MAIKGYNFKTSAVKVTTPEATTLFMCLAEVNEFTGKFGGKLIFTPEALEQEVNYQVIGESRGKKAFKDVFNDLLEAAYLEYVQDSGKKAAKVAKIRESKDAEGNENGLFELSCGNLEKPTIQNTDRTVEKDYSTLIANGSTMKANLYLKPYIMNGKLGITAYLNGVLLINVIEFGGGDVMFDDEDFTDSPVKDELEF